MLSGTRRRRSTGSSKSSKGGADDRLSTENLDLSENYGADDIIESEEEMESDSDVDLSDDEKETVDAKRIRLAREYLNKMEQAESDADSSSEEEEDDDVIDEEERISRRLERRRLKQQGIYERLVASSVQNGVTLSWQECGSDISSTDCRGQAKAWVESGRVKLCRGHDLTPTCVALHKPSGSFAFSASKDNTVLMWDIDNEKRMQTIIPKWNPNTCDYSKNSGEVLAMAVSDDGKYLATGGRDATVKIYDVRLKSKSGKAAIATNASDNSEIRGLVTTFEGHKGPVTALTFRSQTMQLFSGSTDRCIRHYNLDEMAYIETLYGHQSGITGISCHGIRHEMPYSVARDRTARAWKLAEETHMIYRGGSKISNADCITAIKDDYFLTGHDDGVLSFWLKDKKRAIATIPESHGKAGNIPRGVACCDSLGGSDFAATGSNDGYIRLWEVSCPQFFVQLLLQHN